MPAVNSFEFVKGEDVEIDWTIYTSRAMTAAQDITGWTFDFKIKRTDADTGASLVTSATSILVAANGTVKTTIAAAQMDLLQGDYRCSLWRTNAGALACLSRDTFAVVDSVRDA